MKGKNLSDKEVKAALVKKALGFDATEIVEEYVSDEQGDIRLSKKKVTTKNVPPDVTALKMLLEDDGTPVSQMTDDELEKEKTRLLELLSKRNKKKKGEKI
ncbi:MAG: hypothetical protein SOT08_05055 [Candidatus Borkfalkiaceae bacterium]|nr:hypothetical protein [Christensenellaceae bacterium]